MSSLPFTGRLGASSSSSFVTDSTGTSVAVGQGTGVDAGGTQNIFLGFNAAKSNTGSSNLIAGYAANSESTGSTTGAVILGANAGLVASNSCYDCAWLSLNALSTVTCNLWL
jgi:hypothetical protein